MAAVSVCCAEEKGDREESAWPRSKGGHGCEMCRGYGYGGVGSPERSELVFSWAMLLLSHS